MTSSTNYKGYELQFSGESGTTLIYQNGSLVSGVASDDVNGKSDNSIHKAKIRIDNGTPSVMGIMTYKEEKEMYIKGGLYN